MPSKITLKQTTSKELSSPATYAIKHSGLEMVLGNIRDNTKSNSKKFNFVFVKLSGQEML